MAIRTEYTEAVRTGDTRNLLSPVLPTIPNAYHTYNPNNTTTDPSENIINSLGHLSLNPMYLSNTTNSFAYNSFADVLLNKEAQRRRWEGTAFDPDTPIGFLLNPIRTLVDSGLLIKNTTIDPVIGSIQLANKSKTDNFTVGKAWSSGLATAGINTLVNVGNTLDILANPVKGLVFEGPEGLIKGWTGDSQGRKQYDAADYIDNGLLAFAAEVVLDPTNLASLGAAGAAKAGIGAIAKGAGTTAVKEVTEELTQQGLKQVGKKLAQEGADKTIKATTQWILGNGEDAVKFVANRFKVGDDVAENFLKSITTNGVLDPKKATQFVDDVDKIARVGVKQYYATPKLNDEAVQNIANSVNNLGSYNFKAIGVSDVNGAVAKHIVAKALPQTVDALPSPIRLLRDLQNVDDVFTKGALIAAGVTTPLAAPVLIGIDAGKRALGKAAMKRASKATRNLVEEFFENVKSVDFTQGNVVVEFTDVTTDTIKTLDNESIQALNDVLYKLYDENTQAVYDAMLKKDYDTAQTLIAKHKEHLVKTIQDATGCKDVETFLHNIKYTDDPTVKGFVQNLNKYVRHANTQIDDAFIHTFHLGRIQRLQDLKHKHSTQDTNYKNLQRFMELESGIRFVEDYTAQAVKIYNNFINNVDFEQLRALLKYADDPNSLYTADLLNEVLYQISRLEKRQQGFKTKLNMEDALAKKHPVYSKVFMNTIEDYQALLQNLQIIGKAYEDFTTPAVKETPIERRLALMALSEKEGNLLTSLGVRLPVSDSFTDPARAADDIITWYRDKGKHVREALNQINASNRTALSEQLELDKANSVLLEFFESPYASYWGNNVSNIKEALDKLDEWSQQLEAFEKMPVEQLQSYLKQTIPEYKPVVDPRAEITLFIKQLPDFGTALTAEPLENIREFVEQRFVVYAIMRSKAAVLNQALSTDVIAQALKDYKTKGTELYNLLHDDAFSGTLQAKEALKSFQRLDAYQTLNQNLSTDLISVFKQLHFSNENAELCCDSVLDALIPFLERVGKFEEHTIAKTLDAVLESANLNINSKFGTPSASIDYLVKKYKLLDYIQGTVHNADVDTDVWYMLAQLDDTPFGELYKLKTKGKYQLIFDIETTSSTKNNAEIFQLAIKLVDDQGNTVDKTLYKVGVKPNTIPPQSFLDKTGTTAAEFINTYCKPTDNVTLWNLNDALLDVQSRFIQRAVDSGKGLPVLCGHNIRAFDLDILSKAKAYQDVFAPIVNTNNVFDSYADVSKQVFSLSDEEVDIVQQVLKTHLMDEAYSALTKKDVYGHIWGFYDSQNISNLREFISDYQPDIKELPKHIDPRSVLYYLTTMDADSLDAYDGIEFALKAFQGNVNKIQAFLDTQDINLVRLVDEALNDLNTVTPRSWKAFKKKLDTIKQAAFNVETRYVKALAPKRSNAQYIFDTLDDLFIELKQTTDVNFILKKVQQSAVFDKLYNIREALQRVDFSNFEDTEGFKIFENAVEVLLERYNIFLNDPTLTNFAAISKTYDLLSEAEIRLSLRDTIETVSKEDSFITATARAYQDSNGVLDTSLEDLTELQRLGMRRTKGSNSLIPEVDIQLNEILSTWNELWSSVKGLDKPVYIKVSAQDIESGISIMKLLNTGVFNTDDLQLNIRRVRDATFVDYFDVEKVLLEYKKVYKDDLVPRSLLDQLSKYAKKISNRRTSLTSAVAEYLYNDAVVLLEQMQQAPKHFPYIKYLSEAAIKDKVTAVATVRSYMPQLQHYFKDVEPDNLFKVAVRNINDLDKAYATIHELRRTKQLSDSDKILKDFDITTADDYVDGVERVEFTADKAAKTIRSKLDDERIYSAYDSALAAALEPFKRLYKTVQTALKKLSTEDHIAWGRCLYNKFDASLVQEAEKTFLDPNLFVKHAPFTGGLQVFTANSSDELMSKVSRLAEDSRIVLSPPVLKRTGSGGGVWCIGAALTQEEAVRQFKNIDPNIKAFYDEGARVFLDTDTPRGLGEVYANSRQLLASRIADVGYSTGDVCTEELTQQIDMLFGPSQTPIVDTDFLKTQGWFDKVRANNMIIGDAVVHRAFNTYYSNNPLLRVQNVYEHHIIPQIDNQALFLNLLLTRENGIDTSDIFTKLSDEELLELINNDQHNMAFVVLRKARGGLEKTKGGFVVEQVRPRTVEDIKALKKVNAHCIPAEFMPSIYKAINEYELPSWAKFLQKISTGYKIGYLGSLGWPVRNLLDSYGKNFIENNLNGVIPLGKDMNQLFNAESVLRKYYDIMNHCGIPVKNLDEYKVLYSMLTDSSDEFASKYLKEIPELHKNASDAARREVQTARKLKELAERFNNLSAADKQILKKNVLSPEMFELTHKFIFNGPSSGLSRKVAEHFYAGAKQVDNSVKGIDKLHKFILEDTPVQYIFDTNQIIEQAARFNRYLNELQRGSSIDTAARKVIEAHFDYSDRSLLMLYLDIIFPFMSFSFKNLTYWADRLSKMPGLARIASDLLESIMNYDSLFNPDYEAYDNFDYHYDAQDGFEPSQPWQMVNAARLYHLLAGNIVWDTGKDVLHDAGYDERMSDLYAVFKLSPSMLDAYTMLTRPLEAFEQRLLPPLAVLYDMVSGVAEGKDLQTTLGQQSLLANLPYVGAYTQRWGINQTLADGFSLNHNNVLQRIKDAGLPMAVASLAGAAYVPHKDHNTWYGADFEYLTELPQSAYSSSPYYRGGGFKPNYYATRLYADPYSTDTPTYKINKLARSSRPKDIYTKSARSKVAHTYSDLFRNQLTFNQLKYRTLDKYYYSK